MRPFLAVATLAVVVSALLLWSWLKPAPPAVVTRVRTVLWDTPQIRAGIVRRRVAISPDGGTVVFMDSTAAGWQLLAKERDRLDATVVAGTADVAGAPTFSPNGAWIAFVTRDGKVKTVPRGGGAPVVIANSANAALPAVAWLDGGSILYVGARHGLWTVAEDGGTPRQLLTEPTESDTASRGFASVAGLPGGEAALLATCSIGCTKAELRVLDLRTLKVTILMPDVLAGWPLPGGVVAFVRKDGGVLAAPFDLRTLTFTRPPASVMEGVRFDGYYSADIAVSANGTMMYVAGAVVANVARRYQPVWVTRTGAATPIDTAWTVPLQGAGCTCDGGFALSPDGRRLALVIWRESVNSDINIKQLDQVPFALTPLTFTGDNWSPAWTADGQSVVYAASEGDNQPGTSLLRRRADRTGAVDTLLPASGLHTFAEVVPTHDTATFILRKQTRSASRRDIVLARRGDTTTTPLIADSTFNEIFPALSPDGRWLAYASNETQGRYEVYVRPFPDVNSFRVRVSQGGGTEPRWAHSGRELFFRNAAGALVSATVVPAATFTQGSQSVLFEGSQFLQIPFEQARSYDVARDDQRFVFMREVVPTASTGPTGPPPMDKLVQVTNWAAEVQAKLAGKVPK